MRQPSRRLMREDFERSFWLKGLRIHVGACTLALTLISADAAFGAASTTVAHRG
ncbi:hypothetical protein LPU83_2491 [Rhizobium favelukesii]|uniref:Uncharacterized protein n=1 Tax=Rhizobium favelukesii TaxID=348824 RepID=W6RV18_9HYPH|nr:hypothetical protein LPU83_2491 [Rhizobium favelukesii]